MAFCVFKYLKQHKELVAAHQIIEQQTAQTDETRIKAARKAASLYAERRQSLFEHLPITTADIVFLGNSITNGCEWAELFRNQHIKNRGINSDNTELILRRLETICVGKPHKLFIMIGINDLGDGKSPDEIVSNYHKILNRIKLQTPTTKVFVQSVLPTNTHLFRNERLKPQSIVDLNLRLHKLCLEYQHTYIDLYSHFTDSEQELKIEFTNDGLHLTGEAYLVWKTLIERYVNSE